ncbi:MAG: transposase [Bacteroidia bacterium]
MSQITLVCEQPQYTFKRRIFMRIFPPEKARAYVKRIHFVHTPKHGSWLNIAENELSAMTRQCLKNRRMGTLENLQEEISAWATDVNLTQRRR